MIFTVFIFYLFTLIYYYINLIECWVNIFDREKKNYKVLDLQTFLRDLISNNISDFFLSYIKLEYASKNV